MSKEVQQGRRKFIQNSVAGIAGLGLLPGMGRSEVPGDASDRNIKRVFRTLGKTGVRLPVVSMGVMNADNPNLVRAALDAGIVHLDTAWVYQRGRNEEMVGSVIKDYDRKDYFIATKVPGMHEDRRTGKILPDTPTGPFLDKFETSMKRLGLQQVDILYLHSVKSAAGARYQPLMEIMTLLKKEGRVKYIGVTTHQREPEVIRAAADAGIYDVILTAYNFRQDHRREVKEAIAYAAGKGIGIVAMKTQAGVYWDKEKQHPINMTAALKWALADENVHTAIPGFTTFDQLNLDLTVMEDLALTREEKAGLEPPPDKTLAGLYCRQCGTCLTQCVGQVNIPDLMRSYMYAYGYRNLQAARDLVEEQQIRENPCRDCRTCSVTCASRFDVRERIADILRIRDIPRDFLA